MGTNCSIVNKTKNNQLMLGRHYYHNVMDCLIDTPEGYSYEEMKKHIVNTIQYLKDNPIEENPNIHGGKANDTYLYWNKKALNFVENNNGYRFSIITEHDDQYYLLSEA